VFLFRVNIIILSEALGIIHIVLAEVVLLILFSSDLVFLISGFVIPVLFPIICILLLFTKDIVNFFRIFIREHKDR